MKFKAEHYSSLKESITDLIKSKGLTMAEVKEHYSQKSETYFLWDLFWLSKWSTVRDDHYNDGNYLDSHIQTALKRIVMELLS